AAASATAVAAGSPPTPAAGPSSASAPPPAAAAASADPIAEAPAAIWYVRPPSGGQYGPAKGDVMRKWLEEGRVSSDSLVGREGWTDWQPAGKFSPNWQPAAAPVAVVAGPGAPISAGSARPAAGRVSGKPRATSGAKIAGLVFLALVCLVLFIVLAVIFMQ